MQQGNYQPAKGLVRLTWPQVEAIDARVSQLCVLTEQSQGEARVVLVIRRGQVRFVEQTTSEELTPGR